MPENEIGNRKELQVEIIASSSYVTVQRNFNEWMKENPNIELFNDPIYQMAASGAGNLNYSITIFYFRTV